MAAERDTPEPKGRSNGNQSLNCVALGGSRQGDAFRAQGGRYQYLLSLRKQNISGGSVTLTIKVSDGTSHSVTLTVRPQSQRPGPRAPGRH